MPASRHGKAWGDGVHYGMGVGRDLNAERDRRVGEGRRTSRAIRGSDLIITSEQLDDDTVIGGRARREGEGGES